MPRRRPARPRGDGPASWQPAGWRGPVVNPRGPRPTPMAEALSSGGNPAGEGEGVTRTSLRRGAPGQERGLPGARALIFCKSGPRAASHCGVGAGSWRWGEMLTVEQSVPRKVLRGGKDKRD